MPCMLRSSGALNRRPRVLYKHFIPTGLANPRRTTEILKLGPDLLLSFPHVRFSPCDFSSELIRSAKQL